MITAKNVWKSYNSIHVLRGVDLDVDMGEVVAIVGRSGSGKTTLLKLVGLLERVDSGTLVVLGMDVTSLDDARASALRLRYIGIVPQTPNLIPYLTVLENVTLPLYLLGVRKSVREARALNVLKELDLHHLASKYPNELSGGEQQRVLIARALVKEPKLLLADEPTAYLDPENSYKVYDILRDVVRNGSSVLVTATNSSDVLFSHRKYVLVNGTLKEF